jgi:hypothetical protein
MRAPAPIVNARMAIRRFNAFYWLSRASTMRMLSSGTDMGMV